jgi:hypothetical protein
MATAAEMIRRLQALKVRELAYQTLDETEDTLLDFNKEQMGKGILSTGEKIQWLRDSHYPYTPPYARWKSSKGLQTSVVDLRVTGSFWDSEYIERHGDEIEYSSSVTLGKYLEKNYGSKIFGVTPDNRSKYTFGEYFSVFKDKMEQATKLNFQ